MQIRRTRNNNEKKIRANPSRSLMIFVALLIVKPATRNVGPHQGSEPAMNATVVKPNTLNMKLGLYVIPGMIETQDDRYFNYIIFLILLFIDNKLFCSRVILDT